MVEQITRNIVEAHGFPGYTVDENAVVRNKAGKIIRPYMRKETGRFEIHLHKNKKMHTMGLHRLVYESFNGSVGDMIQVDHIDAIRTNNNLSNLRAITKEENLKNRPYMPKGEEVNTAKLNNVIVISIRSEYPMMTVAQLSRKYGVNPSTVSRIVTGKSWKHLLDNTIKTDKQATVKRKVGKEDYLDFIEDI